ncbi:MAG: hypothetical protein AB7S75_00150 [Desulfococcaceae bacterium]
MQIWTLRVRPLCIGDAERPEGIPTRSVGTSANLNVRLRLVIELAEIR